ncbi:MAG: DUF4337 family protein [Oligoflexia bacterium]|nr:DUF4337 family protein [Oligoflexia bacterium]MBF0364109.1 DUF4337 family protein [Oligoflexia bacterium]
MTYWQENSESIFAVTIAILAALLAITDLVAGRYGDDELKFTNEKSAAYMWYQAKSIKEYVVKGQADTLETLLKAEVIRSESRPAFLEQKNTLLKNIERYKKEKLEILLGSKAVGESNWVQDVDGKMGVVVGAKELEASVENLGAAGDRFDLASLFFQISLVIGALGILVKNARIKSYAYGMTLGLAVIGTAFAVRGIIIVS